jgi:tripartite-type tricarboxylate transporter receptor subunit TctC
MTTLSRRQLTLGMLSLGAGLPWVAQAQPRFELLRVVCGYPPGGSADIICRKLAERLGGARHAANAVVENKPGAAGRLVVEELKRAPADTPMLLITPASVVTMYPHVFRQLAYDPFTDVTPVSTVAATGFALCVGAKVPASVSTLDDFLQWCRANPALAQIGNPGAGSMPHLMALQLEREGRAAITHVPYRGGSVAFTAAASGEVAASLSTEAGARPLVQAGKLRVLATSGSDRSPFYPQVPTFREQGLPALTQREWFGAFMPPRAPAAAVQAMADALRAVLQEADVRDTWERAGLLADASGPTALQAAMRSEHAQWGMVVKSTGFTPES